MEIANYFKFYLAENPYLNDKIQLVLANNHHCDMRELLSNNLNLSKEAQIILANDRNHYVRKNLLHNPLLYKEPQLILAKDKEWYINVIINYSDNLSGDTKINLILDLFD